MVDSDVYLYEGTGHIPIWFFAATDVYHSAFGIFGQPLPNRRIDDTEDQPVMLFFEWKRYFI